MVVVNIDYHRLMKWLYFDHGFDKYEPVPEIILWMAERGYRYQRDWFCEIHPPSRYQYQTYTLSFATEEMASMFLLRWS